jgi:hypothetical protein
MAFAVGDRVLVPNGVIGRTDAISAISEYRIVQIPSSPMAKTVSIDVGDDTPRRVHRSQIHSHIGIRVVRVGDLGSEDHLLDPLAKTINHFFRLLVAEDIYRLIYLRTPQEFMRFWERDHGAITHLVLLGHGKANSIKFVGDEEGKELWVDADQFSKIFEKAHPPSPLHVLSLACSNGRAAFSKTLSNSEQCVDCTAPFNDIHGTIASQFAQTLFLDFLLNGRTWLSAVKHARESTVGLAGFRMWRDGRLVLGSH